MFTSVSEKGMLCHLQDFFPHPKIYLKKENLTSCVVEAVPTMANFIFEV